MVTAISDVGNYLGLGNAPNVLTGGLTDQPDWTPANIDPQTAQIIQQQVAQGNKTPQQIAAEQLQGTSSTMPSATGGAVAHQQSTLGGSPDASVSQALDDRANRLYAAQYNQLQNAAIAGAPARQGQFMSQSANSLQQQQNVNDELNRQQMAVTLQKQGMRNQIITQLLGGVGNFFGTYAATQKLPSSTQSMMDSMNSENNPSNPGNYRSDPNQPYNLTGDQTNSPNYLGMPQGYNSGYGAPGEDGNGYYGEKPASSSGYGLGVSFNRSG